jgi:hypothetical protein
VFRIGENQGLSLRRLQDCLYTGTLKNNLQRDIAATFSTLSAVIYWEKRFGENSLHSIEA